VFHKTTTLSQLWAYLHLPFHVCIVLVGTGALDLIRLYKLENHITEMTIGSSHLTSNAAAARFIPNVALSLMDLSENYYFALGFEIPIERRSAAGASGPGSLLERATDYDLTKKYFLVALPLEKMTPFVLLGVMAFFCVVQVGVDLAVIYFGAYGFVNDLEAWARSARSSIDLGSFLPSPLGGRSRANSRAGSVVNLNGLVPSGGKGIGMNNSVTSLINPTGSPLTTTASYFPQQQQQQQQLQKPQEHQLQHQLSLQQQTSSLSQQQQQALYNMHVNANSLGASGPYGNLVQALAEIKRREHWAHPSGDGSTPIRQVSLRATERGIHSVPRNGSSTDGPHGSKMHIQRNSLSLNRPGIVGSISSLSSSPRSPSAGAGAGAGALKLATMFDQPLLPPQQQGKQSPSLSSTHVQLK
ncbi:hypothetical protein BX616_003291, partial [Lobosporangium transversale]